MGAAPPPLTVELPPDPVGIVPLLLIVKFPLDPEAEGKTDDTTEVMAEVVPDVETEVVKVELNSPDEVDVEV